MEPPDGEGRVGVCTRNQDWLANAENPLWKVALEMNLLNKVRQIGGDVAVQGEFVGSSVMANTMGFAEGNTLSACLRYGILRSRRTCLWLGLWRYGRGWICRIHLLLAAAGSASLLAISRIW